MKRPELPRKPLGTNRLDRTRSIFVTSILLTLVLAVSYYVIRATFPGSAIIDDVLAFAAVCAIALPTSYTLARVYNSRRITLVAIAASVLIVLPSTLSLMHSTVFESWERAPYLRAYFEYRQEINNTALMCGILLFFVAFYLSMLETERHKMRLEEQMRDAQDRDEAYKALVENTLQALVIWRDRVFLFVNSVFEEMSGYSAEEALTMTPEQVRDLIHPDDREMVWERGARRLAGHNEPVRYEFRMLCKDGSVKWLEAFTTLTQFGGKPAIQQAGIDITERKAAEKALRDSEQKYRTMADNISDVVWTMDLESHFTYVSPSVEHILGYSAEEALTSDPARVLVPGALERLGDLIKDARTRVAEGGDPWVTQAPEEFDHYHKDGRVVTCEMSVMLIQDDSGKPTGVIGATRDVTERKRVEKALRSSEEKYRTLAESISDVVWTIGMDGRITYCNRAAEAVLGYQPKELLGMDIRQLLTEKACERARLGIQDSVDKNARGIQELGAPREYDHVHKNGTIVPCEVMSRLLLDRDGNPLGVVGVSRDIRERKRAETERRRFESQVQQAQKLESLGILAGGIAHDFNNILVGILGNADLALEELPVGAPARAYLHQINLSAKRAADLARQMLAYSGKGKFVVEEIDLNDLVLEMSHLLDASIPKNVTMAFNLASELPAIEVDATQVRQVFMNLVINAAESIGKRKGIVTVSTRLQNLRAGELEDGYLDQQVPPGPYVCIEVRDNGCGMSEETRHRIFDPFFSTKFTGRGLGLSAVLGIVRGHHSAIEVKSALDKGTAVRVFFPALEVSACSVRKRQAEASSLNWRGTGKVLVVDDEATVLMVAQRILEHLGFEVLLAENGQQAIEIFKDNADAIKVVLLDLTMPHMGGEETFDAIRQIRPDVPVVLSSGYPEERAKAGFRGQELAGFVQKPYTVNALANVIHARFS